MAVLRQRHCVLIVDRLRIEGLRVVFKVNKGLGKEPNTLDAMVYNLSETSRRQMQSKGAKVVLLAGYEGDHAQIFSGDSRSIDHRQNGPDWETRIGCGDGERAYQFARCSESFAPGTPVSAVLKHLCAQLIVDQGNAVEQCNTVPGHFIQGCSVHGRASEEIEKILRPRGYHWSVQDGQLQVLKGGEAAKQTAVLLSPSSGLVGSPEVCTPAKKGEAAILKVKSLLRPQFRAGGRLRLESAQHNGTFRIETLMHSGDTAGGDWYSDLECKVSP